MKMMFELEKNGESKKKCNYWQHTQIANTFFTSVWKSKRYYTHPSMRCDGQDGWQAQISRKNCKKNIFA